MKVYNFHATTGGLIMFNGLSSFLLICPDSDEIPLLKY